LRVPSGCRQNDADALQFVQALVPGRRGLRSPTFTLVQAYEAPRLLHRPRRPLSHRKNAREIAELGSDEALEAGALVVEWPDLYGEADAG
jgi:tRNA A37 threonylcarbamoyladenosine biosynthesis protein TsaE